MIDGKPVSELTVYAKWDIEEKGMTRVDDITPPNTDGNDQIIVLQTCDVTNEGEYIIVVGKKIKTISNEAS